MAKLDKSRDYATVINCLEGRAFEQDGKFFAADGREWKPGMDTPETKEPEQKGKLTAAPVVDDQLSNQLQG